MSRRKIVSEPQTALLLICMLATILVFSSPVVPASAKLWAYHEEANGQSDILKPVDPVFINDKETILMDVGEEWSLSYPLEAGKRYHIFLVGDWINNGTEPLTDYDITSYDPYGDKISTHTESAGLPEQVANDGLHQYFVPEETGDYTFRIINDPRDSKNDQSAVFMVIEHIDTNVRYTQYLEGRDEQTDEEMLLTGWAYEFNTSSPSIRVYVDVPDTLDMYEVRLYAMANPDEGVGYSIEGLGCPSENLFEGFSGEYGGFTTSCKGNRNPKAVDSCEYSGQDMAFVYNTPNGVDGTSNIFYYIVLIAEHDEGTVEFYAQTDFDPPNVTMVEPPKRGYATEETHIEASVEDASGCRRVWAEYTDDGGETLGKVELTHRGHRFTGDLPPFSAGSYVNYTVYAEDDFGNVGLIDAGFPVKNRVTIDCDVVDSSLRGAQSLEVRGRVSPSPLALILRFSNMDFNESVEVVSDDSGAFDYVYMPRLTGDWGLRALFNGSTLYFSTSSGPVNFTVEREPTSVICSLSESEVKRNEPITVSGTVNPAVHGLAVKVTFASLISCHTETVAVDVDGGFSCAFKPPEVGTWDVLAEVKGDEIYASSQSGLMELVVRPLTLLDRVSRALLMMITPPYQYLTIALIGVASTLAIFKERARLSPT